MPLYDHRVSDAAPTVEARIPASTRDAIAAQLERAAQAHVAERVREGDASLWGPEGTPEIADRLGWLTIAERMLAEADALSEFADRVRDDGLRDVVLLGMGGSSLAPEVLRRSFDSAPGRPRLHVLDSTDAAWVRAVGEAVDPHSTLFVVSSKSGGTIEPLSLFVHFWSLVPDGANFAAITDPGSGLEKLAHEHGFRHVFAGDPDIGGRYSALSAFGMVPGGADRRRHPRPAAGRAGAWQTGLTTEASDGAVDPDLGGDLAGVWMGAALSALAQAGRDKLTFVIDESLPGLGLWLEQLVAESTGKRGTGILPVAEEPLGDPCVYGEDRVFAYLHDLDAPDPALQQRAGGARCRAVIRYCAMPDARAARSRPRVHLSRRSQSRSPAGGSPSTRSTSPTCSRPRTRPSGCSRATNQRRAAERASADADALRELLLGGRAAELCRDHGLRAALDEPSTRPSPSCARRSARPRQGDDDVRLRAALPALDRAVPQGRAERRPLPAAAATTGREDVEIPGAAYTFTTLKNAAGDRRLRDAARARPAGRARAARRR